MSFMVFLFLVIRPALAQDPIPSPTATELPGLTIIGSGGEIVSDAGPRDRRSESTLGGIVPFAAPSLQAQAGQVVRDSLQITCECNCPPPQAVAGLASETEQSALASDFDEQSPREESSREALAPPDDTGQPGRAGVFGPPAPTSSP